MTGLSTANAIYTPRTLALLFSSLSVSCTVLSASDLTAAISASWFLMLASAASRRDCVACNNRLKRDAMKNRIHNSYTQVSTLSLLKSIISLIPFNTYYWYQNTNCYYSNEEKTGDPKMWFTVTNTASLYLAHPYPPGAIPLV